MAITSKKIIETKSDSKETLLTPRFYTTNFKEISELTQRKNMAFFDNESNLKIWEVLNNLGYKYKK